MPHLEIPRRVLLIGASGRLGRHVVDALIEKGHHVVALVRPLAQANSVRRQLLDRFLRVGVEIVEGSLEDEECLARACRDADAVVSCVDHRPDRLQLQANLARAAGRYRRVKRIVPSQFGIDSRLYGEAKVDHGDLKRQMQSVFTDCGTAITFVHTNGLAAEWVGSLGQLGLSQPPREEVEVYGRGTVRFSTVAPQDAARYVVRTLFDPRTADKHVAIVPPENLLTQHELIDLWEAKSGTMLRRRTVSAEALDARIAELASDPTSRPQLAMAQLVRAAWIDGLGDGRRLPDALGLIELYPELGYVRASEYLDRYLLHASFANVSSLHQDTDCRG
jgi:uncharacterized protein YbjT (DUF2867 family)